MNAPARPRVPWRPVDGVLLLDKPVGLSSNAALQRARRLFRAAKAGHTGSLDPLASGMLPLCFGAATKVAGYLLEGDKRYAFRLALGRQTATGDAEGEVIATAPVPPLAAGAIEAALAGLRGAQRQVPPMHSALKRDGRPLYELARQGIEVERAARDLVIHELTCTAAGPDWLDCVVTCSKGTYVRVLGEAVAAALGTVGHLAALRRLWAAPFAGLAMASFEELEALAAGPDAAGGEAALDRLLLPPDAALTGLPQAALDTATAQALVHGQRPAVPEGTGLRVPPEGAAPALHRVYGPDGVFLGLAALHGPAAAGGAGAVAVPHWQAVRLFLPPTPEMHGSA